MFTLIFHKVPKMMAVQALRSVFFVYRYNHVSRRRLTCFVSVKGEQVVPLLAMLLPPGCVWCVRCAQRGRM
jgi:hypothetical protein